MKTGTKMKKLGAAKDRYGKPLATAAKGGYSAGKKVGGLIGKGIKTLVNDPGTAGSQM
jgi:hypothetical protein